jgi:hypothetical protein
MAFDTDDTALFDSSFMPDGIFDVNGRAMQGLSDIHDAGLSLIFSLDTTHLTTNVRVHMNTGTTEVDSVKEREASEASLTSTVLSQHFAKDKGMAPGQPSLMAGSLYRGDLARDADGLWKFKHLQIKSIWAEGDWSLVGVNVNEGGE